MINNLNASDDRARKRAEAYLKARDVLDAKYLEKYPGKLPRGIARRLHERTLALLKTEY